MMGLTLPPLGGGGGGGIGPLVLGGGGTFVRMGNWGCGPGGGGGGFCWKFSW